MKKILVVVLSLVMVFTLTACGGSSTEATSTTADDVVVTEAPVVDTEAPVADAVALTPEQQTFKDSYDAMADRFNALSETFNADANLLALDEVQSIANQIVNTLNDKFGTVDPAQLTSDDIAAYTELLDSTNLFIDQFEALINNYGAQASITIPITVQNDTGADLYTLAMSPANSNSWGSNLIGEGLLSGESASSTMTITQDTVVWDLLAADSEGTPIEFYGLDFSIVDAVQGATLVLYYDEAAQSYVAGFDVGGN